MFRGFLTDPRPTRPPDEPPPTALAGSSIWFRSMILSMKKGANFHFQKTFENALRLVLIIVSDARSWKTEKISKYLNLYLRLSQQVKEPSDADLLFCFALTNRSLCTSFRWFSIIHADRLFFGGDRVPAVPPTARGLIPPNPNSRRSRARAKAALLSTNSSTDTQLMSIPSNGQTFCELQNFFSQCSPPNVTDINCPIGLENGPPPFVDPIPHHDASAAVLINTPATNTQSLSTPSNGQTFCELQTLFSQSIPLDVTDIDCCAASGVENASALCLRDKGTTRAAPRANLLCPLI